MGASRKLQGEIDRVLKKVQEGVDVFDSIWNKVYDTDNANQKEKFEADLKKEIKKLQRYRDQIKTWIQSSEIKDKKVSASYEQALMDARRQIEREMERFKVCEKETKTKAFSKEGLGLQPKTDPKEKAKSETRDWLNNVVGDLELQIEGFEAEVEALSVKKGKTRPPRLVHLETSIVRHKAHIMKLELILRLLDNDELSPEQVNDVKDFVDDYVERNQDDFDEFSNVDELYSSLPLEKVDSLEEFSPSGSSAFKGVASVSSASAALGLKNTAVSSTQGSNALSPAAQQGNSTQDQVEEAGSQESTLDSGLKGMPSKTGITGTSVSSSSTNTNSATTLPNPAAAVSTTRTLAGDSTAPAVLSGTGPVRGVLEISAASSSLVNPPSSTKDDDGMPFVGRKQSPAPADMVLGRGLGKGPMVGGSSQASVTVPVSLGSGGGSAIGALGSVPAVADIAKRNTLGSDERLGMGNIAQPVASPLNSRVLLQQTSKVNDGLGPMNASSIGDNSAISGRVFTPLMVSNPQWRSQNMGSFQSQTDAGQFRGRTEITPDQKEKYLQRFQQVHQQGPSNLLSASHILGASQKQYPGQQQNTILQQFNSQSSQTQVGLGLGGVQVPGVQQQNSVYQQPLPQSVISSGPKESGKECLDADVNLTKAEEQVLLSPSEDLNSEPRPDSGSEKNVEEDFKSPYMSAASTAESSMLSRDMDLSPKKPLQSHQSSSIGVIGRRSISDLGAIGDNISTSGGNAGGLHDHIYNLQMLEAAYNKRPQPKDSERVKNYIPRNPAVTPPSYPQVQVPVVNNPLLWEKFGTSNQGTDTLFFAFYYQQNTYQQYLAARELKKQSWRYHRKYNTWFQRHEEPKVTTDDYEQGTYVYFDFHIAEDHLQHGWCQRIKTDFTFEYSYLEDELNA